MTDMRTTFNRAIDSVRLPLEHFLETGFWNPYACPGWTRNNVSDVQVRRICRHVATENKRPFIQCYASMTLWEYVDDLANPFPNGGGYYKKRVEIPKPKFSVGIISAPNRQHLAPLVAPLLLTEGSAKVQNHSSTGLWQFYVHDEELWNSYYDFVLNDPACRKARKLTS